MLERIFKSRRSKAAFVSYFDCLLPKKKNKILFVVKDRTCYSGNIRVTLEAYLENGHTNLYIYKNGPLHKELKDELSSKGITVLKGFKLYTLWHILTSGTVIFSHNPRDAHITKKCKGRLIVNLWHGVAIKKIEMLMNTDAEKRALLENNARLYDLIIASSEADKKTNAKAFGVPESKVKITGLPRYEILKESYTLSDHLRTEEEKILHMKSNKRLVLIAPTFREKNKSFFSHISEQDWEKIDKFAEENNFIFGLRPHPYDCDKDFAFIDRLSNVELISHSDIVETNLLLKHTDILVVDFSSIWVDYLLLDRPVIGFAKDYTSYIDDERGFVYNFNEVFPGVFTDNVDDLLRSIYSETFNKKYEYSKKLFHRYSLSADFKKMIYTTIEKQRKNL